MTQATEMPEQIWAWEIDHDFFPIGYYSLEEADESTPYVRADLIPQWQPIETAPKDELLLLWGFLDPIPTEKQLYSRLEKPTRTVGHWSDLDDCWAVYPSPWTGPFFKPSHWMPLPTPPETA